MLSLLVSGMTGTDDAVADYLLDPGASVHDLVDPAALERLVRTHRHANGTYTVLSLLMLEIWLRTYLPRAVAATTAP